MTVVHCPYCRRVCGGSRDHIFPKFLGGQRTIAACKECNDLFGHSFEGPISADFARIAVLLHHAGIRPPKLAVWKRAIQKHGHFYDLRYGADGNWIATISSPAISQDDEGNVHVRVPPGKLARQVAKDLARKGFQITTINPNGADTIEIPVLDLHLTIGDEIKRLAIKLAVASAVHLGFDGNLLSAKVRAALLGEQSPSDDVVVIDSRVHAELEALRPPLSHMVFVKANGRTGRYYGVVQFYGAFQFYVVLGERFVGNDKAGVGVLDIAKDYQETFRETELHSLQFPKTPFHDSSTSNVNRSGIRNLLAKPGSYWVSTQSKPSAQSIPWNGRSSGLPAAAQH